MPSGQNLFYDLGQCGWQKVFLKPAELTFQTLKVTPPKQPLTGAVETVNSFLPLTTATDQTGTDQAPIAQKQVPDTSTAMLPQRLDRLDS